MFLWSCMLSFKSTYRQLEQSSEASAPPLRSLWCEQSDMMSGELAEYLTTMWVYINVYSQLFTLIFL